MTQAVLDRMTDKWWLVVTEYEKVKQKRSHRFTKVQEICDTYKVQRKDNKLPRTYARGISLMQARYSCSFACPKSSFS